MAELLKDERPPAAAVRINSSIAGPRCERLPAIAYRTSGTVVTASATSTDVLRPRLVSRRVDVAVADRGERGRCQLPDAVPSPRRRAAAAASLRVRTSSFRRIAETWWSTVRCERKSRSAMSLLRRPSPTSERTSSSRPVRPAGFARAAGRGTPRAPSARSLRATIAAEHDQVRNRALDHGERGAAVVTSYRSATSVRSSPPSPRGGGYARSARRRVCCVYVPKTMSQYGTLTPKPRSSSSK